MEHPIVFFDGVCNFCNGSVNFIIRRDPKKVFRFAPLQSAVARQHLQALENSHPDLDSIVLMEGDRVYVKSSAALRIARKLSGLWPVFYILVILPRSLRDWVYDWFARHRYQWFGKTDSCMIPSREIEALFLS